MFRRIFPKDIRLSISTRIAHIFGIYVFFRCTFYIFNNKHIENSCAQSKSDELLENTIRISHEFKNFETQSELVKLAIRLSNDKNNKMAKSSKQF